MMSGSGAVETGKKLLEIKYHAIGGTVSVGGKAYQLANGNIFIIRVSEDWTPIVSQIEVHQDEQLTEQRVLDRLKSILRDDESIQRLELH